MTMANCASQQTTTIAILTGPGRAAVAVLAISGQRAVELTERHFFAANREPLFDQPIGRIIFGHWDSVNGEEMILCRYNSDTIEIHCHGGSQAAPRMLDQFLNEGCQSISWDAWLARQTGDRLQTEAQMAVAYALTRRTAAILLDQIHGALRYEILDLCRLLSSASAITNSRVIVRDKGVDDPTTLGNTALGNTALDHALCHINRLLDRAEIGSHLTRPWHMMIAGRPNVGKSSLTNAMLGYDRSIVFDVPGTTRDVVTARGAFDGWPVWIEDTAGMRHASDPLEREGIQLARQRLPAIDLLVWVLSAPELEDTIGMDASLTPGQIAQGEIDEYLGKLSDELPIEVVINKIDCCSSGHVADTNGARDINMEVPVRENIHRWDSAAGISVTCATSGDGVEPLIAKLARKLVPTHLQPGAAVPINERQRNGLLDAGRALGRRNPSSALKALKRLVDMPAS
jgi:tRNA modification GTPase